MRTYVIRRLLLVVPTLFLVTIIVFLIVRSIPGDVIDVMMSEMSELGASLDRERIMQMLGLDLPVHVQYGRWIGGVLQGDLGVSLRGDVPITPKILARLPVTFELGVFAVIIGLLISLPIGIYSAIRQNTVGDYAGRGIAVTFISVPTFWTATMVMIYPALWWGWAPPMRLIPFTADPLGNLGMFLLPAAILGMVLSANESRTGGAKKALALR